MADTKQAAAEVVRCEHCGKTIREFGITPDSGKGKCWVHADGKRRRHIATPRTQPSQTELRIPDDLKDYYEDAKRRAVGYLSLEIRLIERIARLERAIRWANGEVDEFPERKPGEGAYWWRKELMRRARLEGGGR